MAAVTRRSLRFSRVWYLNAALAATVVALIPVVVDWPAVGSGLRMSWPIVALIYAVAEAAVLHFRFRRDAHSLSMGEIALTIALFTASPFHHIIGQVVGNTVAFVANRRQTPVKAAFNLAQFTLQTVAALSVFRLVLGDAEPLGMRGWWAALAGSMAALAVSDVAVNWAILLSGGSVGRRERWSIRGFSSLAALMNTAMGVLIVLVWTVSTPAVVLAVLPPVMLFLAYRAYTGQRADRSRVIALQRAAEGLLSTETLADVARVASRQLQQMFEVERALVTIALQGGSGAFVGTCGADGVAMAHTVEGLTDMPVSGDARILASSEIATLDGDSGQARGVLYAPIVLGSHQVGSLLAVEPLSDVFRFGDADVRLIGAFSGQVATVVENERLGGAVSALSELVESKNEVLAAVGHELRSPLAAVVSAAATLESRGDQLTVEQRSELVELIQRNGMELSAVADDLMVAARNEDALAPEPREVDPVHEIRTVLAGLVDSPKGVVVRGEGCPIWADPNRVRQVVRNLVVNAGRYGGQSVWIELEPHRESLAISVVDDGDGVPDVMAERIFEPYATAHEGAERPQALGLGLAISRRLARSMGGDVTYQRVDGSTRFTLTLPRFIEVAADAG